MSRRKKIKRFLELQLICRSITRGFFWKSRLIKIVITAIVDRYSSNNRRRRYPTSFPPGKDILGCLLETNLLFLSTRLLRYQLMLEQTCSIKNACRLRYMYLQNETWHNAKYLVVEQIEIK